MLLKIHLLKDRRQINFQAGEETDRGLIAFRQAHVERRDKHAAVFAFQKDMKLRR